MGLLGTLARFVRLGLLGRDGSLLYLGSTPRSWLATAQWVGFRSLARLGRVDHFIASARLERMGLLLRHGSLMLDGSAPARWLARSSRVY